MLQTGLDFMEATVELTGVAKSKLSKLYSRNINSVQGYADLCKTATKIKHKAMEKRKCLSGKIKFALFPRSLWLWSLRRNSGIDVLIKEFKQGLKDIHGKLASEADETSTSLKKEIEEYFECIGESIESSGQPETGEERSAESLETIDDTIQNSEHHILAFLHGKNVFGGEMSDTGEILISLDSVMESFLGKLNISKIDGIKNLTEKHLQDCIDENKSIMIIEGGDVERNCNVLLIRKNEKGTLEVTRFTEQPKTLKSNGGIQMDSGDYVNAFQLFDLKNSESFETKKTNLQRICSGSVQAKEVPKEKMFLTKSRGKNTSPEFELLQALQYAAKGNPSQEALVAEFEIGRYVAHLSNFKSKMETPEQNLLFDRNTVTFNTLSRDVQQRILSLQASGKISTEAASKYLSQINRMIVSPAERTSNPAAVDPSLTSEAGAQSLRSHTTYTQDSTLQTSNGYNVGVYKDIPTFLKQTMCDNDDYMSVRLTMGFASAQRFEELISNHEDTLEALKGENATETLKNIVGFFRMAVVYTEYNKRNGIAVPKDKQEIYDNLIKLGAAIYEKYGKECEINETTYQC
ncbi:MAG: hypothetical protein LBD34_01685, partial [Puniceicoccales bacterium]|nr:hypothetical protein [Puniceicoccales bacterium]